jgi:flagellar biosynthesis protein FliP
MGIADWLEFYAPWPYCFELFVQIIFPFLIIGLASSNLLFASGML